MLAPSPGTPTLPDWLENTRLPDALAQQAYDKFDALPRSLIKTATALASYHFSPDRNVLYVEKSNPALAFSSRLISWPASWTFLFFAPGFDAAALACAAAILPQLCDISHIYAFCLEEKPAAQLLATLELCGIEEIFCLDFVQCQSLLAGLPSRSSLNKNINWGRALLLDQDNSSALLARELDARLPFIHLNRKASICLEKPDSWDYKLLRLMLGSDFQLQEKPELCDVFYVASDEMPSRSDLSQYSAPLVLTPDLLGFWIFPELDADFFMMRKLAFDLYKSPMQA